MPLRVLAREPVWRICSEGKLSLAAAAELKELMLEWLASGKDLELDLEKTEEIDIPTMQVIWAAEREAIDTGAVLVPIFPPSVRAAARDSGFEQISRIFAPGPEHA